MDLRLFIKNNIFVNTLKFDDYDSICVIFYVNFVYWNERGGVKNIFYPARFIKDSIY